MGIDTSQFDAGLRRTQKQIDDVAARMAKASEENRQRARQHARMAKGMAGMGVGVTPEDRRLSEQIATRLKTNQIVNQQNQLLEQNRARQQAINAEIERYNRVTSTLLVNMIRRTQQEAIDNRQLAVNIAAKLKLIQITDSERAALERSRETAQQWTAQVINATNAQRAFAATKSIEAREAEGMAFSQALQARMQTEQLEKEQLELANAQERDRQLSKEIQTRLTLNTIYAQQNALIKEQERLEAEAEGRVQIRKMLNDEEEKTNALLALQNKQRKELLEFRKQLDAAGLKGRSRKVLIEEFQALQAATKAQWEKGNAQKYVTDLERKAEAVKERLITAEQRHAATMVDLKNMLQQNLLTQGQYAAAVKQTDQTLAMQKGGFGRMAGAATQASFAIEDFVQVMSMGGGLNMALMSASNNVTMVIRSLDLFKGTLGTVAMFGLPLLAVGVTSAIGYFTKASKATDRWKDALEELERTWKNSGWREMAAVK
jgi:hypothetical protein